MGNHNDELLPDGCPRAESDLRRQVRHQEVVAELGLRALSGCELDDLMQASVAAVAQTLEIPYCSVLESLPQQDGLRLRAGAGWKPELIGTAIVATGDDSQASHTLLTGEPVMVEDFRRETRFRGPKLLLDNQVLSGLTVRIQGHGRPFGVMSAYSSQACAFTRDEAYFLQAVANVLAAAIERKRAGRALKESEERLRLLSTSQQQLLSILEVATDFIGMADTEGNVLYLNRAGRRMVGIAEDEDLTHLKITDYRPPWAAALVLNEAMPQAALSGRWQGETAFRHRDGHEIPVSQVIVPHLGGNGKVCAFSTIARDIRERQSAEEARLRLAAIVESSEDAIIGKSLEGIITSWNTGAERIFGYSKEEAIGQPISFLAPPERKNEMPALLERLKRGERIQHFETVRVTKSGERINVALTISPVKDSSGRIIGASKIARDVTERKRAEEALRVTEKLAAAGRLAAAMAHEVNNPLEAVTNLLYLLETHSTLDAAGQRYARLAQEELGRVAHITRQTLAFYRDEAVQLPSSIADLLDSLLELYGQKLRSRKVSVDRRFDSAGTILANPGELRQVFSNLIANALEAVPAGGSIKLHVFESRDWRHPHTSGIRVTIMDNGGGIAPENRQQIFEPFFTTKGAKGTGLGLWVTRGIVHKFGGTIRLRSSVRPERSGTCFSVFLPLKTAEVQQANPAESLKSTA